jgi:hypothetical protein
LKTNTLIPIENIERRIFLIRGMKVILDADLARLYCVGTKVLNQAVKRNLTRFPGDFMFRLRNADMATMSQQAEERNISQMNRSQFVTGSQKHRDPKSLPYVFTEHGALMVANVLRSDRALRVSVFVVRAFIALRENLSKHSELAAKLSALEHKVSEHDIDIHLLIESIRRLLETPEPPKRGIGF